MAKDTERDEAGFLLSLGGLFPPEVGTSVFRPRIRIPFQANLLFRRYLHYALIPWAETRAKDPPSRDSDGFQPNGTFNAESGILA
ncbi:unnamed protein product [Lasius platythorax]|uniref:Uncharacterized protein n=1 Tax=Lasius platythorax TaxID=488582 RepID=A0AAV2NHT6_9HYME